MLKTVKYSEANKTSGCAVTYRAGASSQYGSCPASCSLNCKPKQSAERVDVPYIKALLRAVPRGGQSFTYTHFAPSHWLPFVGKRERETVINYSARNLESAAKYQRRGVPSVAVVPREFWSGQASTKAAHSGGVRAIRCPAEYNKRVNCSNCGGSGGALCARKRRDYVVLFTAHGAGAKHAENTKRGGCYAEYGRVAIHWRDTIKGAPNDAQALRSFVLGLPNGATLRHHVAGDLGRFS